jgi:DNA adenine methylase
MHGPLSYIGGKNRLAATIVTLIPPHLTYVEPFAGGAQVFFRKTPSKVEILNDLNNDVTTFFRVCQLHHPELIRYLTFTVPSRTWFDILSRTDPSTLTDIQRAARFLYLQKNAFASRVARRNFAVNVVQPKHYRPDRLAAIIEEAAVRLRNAQIECAPYEQILTRCDRPQTFFYLDPPYFGRDLYAYNFTEEQFDELALRLRSLKAKFLLSLNDVPEIRRIFRGFTLRRVTLAYSAQKKVGNRYSELLIANYSFPKVVGAPSDSGTADSLSVST